jgi:hypothetical protein
MTVFMTFLRADGCRVLELGQILVRQFPIPTELRIDEQTGIIIRPVRLNPVTFPVFHLREVMTHRQLR